MRIEQLYYLIEVSKCQSINLASQKLHISQQSLSKSLRALEQDLGVTLLNRSTKGITLTPNGVIVVEKGSNILAEYADMSQALQPEVANISKPITEQLRLLNNNSFNRFLMSSALEELRLNHPNIAVSLHEQSVFSAVKLLMDNACDIALLTLTSDELDQKTTQSFDFDSDQLLLKPLKESKLLIATHKSLPIAKQKTISLRTILKYPLILLEHEVGIELSKSWLYKLLSHYGEPNFIFRTNNLPMYYQSIAQKTGIGFTFQSSKHVSQIENYPEIITLPIRDNIKVYSCYLVQKNLLKQPQIQAFINILENL